MPTAAAQQSALKLVQDVFAEAYADKSKAGHEALLYKLLQEEQSGEDDASGRYVLLSEAKEAAIQIGDFPAALYATGKLFDQYDVRPIELLSDLLTRMGPGLKGQDAADGAIVGLLLTEALDKRFIPAEARKLFPLTRELASASHNDKVVSAITRRLTRVELDAVAADRADEAMKKLKSDPDDVGANLIAGQYLCFVRGDFSSGCALLARTDDPELKSAAIAELAKPTTPENQNACGDLWWNVASARANTPLLANGCKARAIYWYRLAMPSLTGAARQLIEQRLANNRSSTGSESPNASLSPDQPKPAKSGPSISVAAAAGWVQTRETVERGQCYRITASGLWIDSDGQKCGPDGACPEPFLKLLGPQDISKQERDRFYCGQHPRGALICRIGDEKWDFYVPSECKFLAPVSGSLSFRMNDDDRGNAAIKDGACAVTVTPIEPEWARPDGRIAIVARIDTTDWLHLTPQGAYWEWDGSHGKVGLQDGYYPTVINGIYWWPQWNTKKTTELLQVPALWPAQPSNVRILQVQAQRGDADISQLDANEIIIHFHKHKGAGASQIGCVISLK